MISTLITFADTHNPSKKQLEFNLIHSEEKVLIDIEKKLEEICSKIEDSNMYSYIDDDYDEENEEYLLFVSIYYDNMTDKEASEFVRAL
jgi:hypothetical protein